MFKKKKDRSVQVTERKQNVINDTAAAAAFSEAGEHETARRMLDKTKGSRTILVIGNNDCFSGRLMDYAVDMAQRLGFELLTLNVTEAPLSLSDEKKIAAISAYRESCLENLRTLMEKAGEKNIPVTNVIECGDLDDVVVKLQNQYPGMRYVLTEPDNESLRFSKGQAAIPVFDLGSFQASSA